MLLVAAVALFAYFVGSFPAGYIAGRMRGIDIRQHGSGNVGATNVFRVLGKRPGVIVFICDAAKGWVAVTAAMMMAREWHIPSIWTDSYFGTELSPSFAGIMAAIGCVLGHNFPCWLRFKGGKGIATSAGVIVAMVPLACLIIAAVWGVTFYLSGYVSLASILAAVSLPVAVFFLMMFGFIQGWAFFYFAMAAGLLALWRHRTNAMRLLNGTEHRFRRGSADEARVIDPAEES